MASDTKKRRMQNMNNVDGTNLHRTMTAESKSDDEGQISVDYSARTIGSIRFDPARLSRLATAHKQERETTQKSCALRWNVKPQVADQSIHLGNDQDIHFYTSKIEHHDPSRDDDPGWMVAPNNNSPSLMQIADKKALERLAELGRLHSPHKISEGGTRPVFGKPIRAHHATRARYPFAESVLRPTQKAIQFSKDSSQGRRDADEDDNFLFQLGKLMEEESSSTRKRSLKRLSLLSEPLKRQSDSATSSLSSTENRAREGDHPKGRKRCWCTLWLVSRLILVAVLLCAGLVKHFDVLDKEELVHTGEEGNGFPLMEKIWSDAKKNWLGAIGSSIKSAYGAVHASTKRGLASRSNNNHVVVAVVKESWQKSHKAIKLFFGNEIMPRISSVINKKHRTAAIPEPTQGHRPQDMKRPAYQKFLDRIQSIARKETSPLHVMDDDDPSWSNNSISPVNEDDYDNIQGEPTSVQPLEDQEEVVAAQSPVGPRRTNWLGPPFTLRVAQRFVNSNSHKKDTTHYYHSSCFLVDMNPEKCFLFSGVSHCCVALDEKDYSVVARPSLSHYQNSHLHRGMHDEFMPVPLLDLAIDFVRERRRRKPKGSMNWFKRMKRNKKGQ